MEKIKVICVKNVIREHPFDDCTEVPFTIGKTYEVISSDMSLGNQKSSAKDYYLIKNDDGHHYSYWKGNFSSLEEWRKKQIDKIIT